MEAQEQTYNNGQTISIKDEETGSVMNIQNPNYLYSKAIPTEDKSYTESSIINVNNQTRQIDFTYPAPPNESYIKEMWDTLDKFEDVAWSPNNTGIKSGYNCFDIAFDGGFYPGFTIIGGDSNLGKTALMTNLAWNIISNNDNVYVMDFSLDDAMRDKLSRMAACSGKLIINAVKTPLRYQQYPLMLARRKIAMLQLRSMADKYCAYDASFSTYVEDIQKEIIDRKIYFDEHGINKKLVVFIDNFHDMEIRDQPNLDPNTKFDVLAQWCSDFAEQYNIVLICTAELKKLNGSKRPMLDDIRQSVKIKYEAKAVILVYNEVHYKNEAASVYYTVPNNPYKQPIFEVHFAKNKFGTYKGRNYFEFYPEMAYLKECDDKSQQSYNSIIYG